METCKSGSEGGCRKPVVYAIRRLCPTLRSVAELHSNHNACKLRVCGTFKAGEYRQFQDGGSYRGIRGTAKIRNQYCIGNGTYQVWLCGDSV